VNLRAIRTIATFEFLRRVKKRGYLVSALLVPLLLIVAIVVVGYLSASAESVSKPIGVVDQAQLLASAEPLPEDDAPEFIHYSDIDTALASLDDGTLAAVFLVTPDYLTTREVISYSPGDLQQEAMEGFRRYLRWNLAAALPESARVPAAGDVELVVRSLDGQRELSESTWPNVVIPFVAAMLFFITVMGSASDAVRAVVEEKESRTIEVLATSVSPNELMAGKIIGLFLVGLTQLLAWGVAVAVALVVAKASIPELSTFRMDWSSLVLAAAMFVPAYLLVSGLLAAAGAASTEMREAQQLASLVTLPAMLPAMLSVAILAHPNGWLSLLLTLFPLTAPLTVTMRWAFTPIPPWQLLASFGLLVASAIGAILLAARVFQAGMLRYGQRLSWAEIRQAIRGNAQ